MDPYPTPAAVDRAIKQAAKNQARGTKQNRGDLVTQTYRDRFLQRLFRYEEGWVLKGGSGILARIPDGRSTQDLDLFRESATNLEEALESMKTAAETALGDHFQFTFKSAEPIAGQEAQPYVDGYRVTFDIAIGTQSKGRLKVDLVHGTHPTGEIVTEEPRALSLKKLPAGPYRLYPLADQVADKICASQSTFAGRTSSRVKDLVDIVLIATTQSFCRGELAIALNKESRLRRMSLQQGLIWPTDWETNYPKLARTVPKLESHLHDFGRATEIVETFISPAVATDSSSQAEWDPVQLRWTDVTKTARS
ncbi:nucleotidyl transferase AbiEii/AbiGii toxin family protein [Nesterenkonia populi]